MSQYNHLCYFPEIVRDRDSIQLAIEAFMSGLNLNIPDLGSYVVDLAVLDDSTVRIIELNPFGENSGSGLFSWFNRDDKAILKGARQEPDFRIVTRPPNEQWVRGEIN